MFRMTKPLFLTLLMVLFVGLGLGQAATKDITVNTSWNLINTPLQPDNPAVDTVLSGLDYISAWKWLGTGWAVKLQDGDTQSYAGSKGFTVLSSLNAGEGFWLNMNGTDTLTVTGSAPSSSFLYYDEDWNLLGLKESGSKDISDVFPAQGLSAWAWGTSGWKVYLPDGLAEYASSKGFDLLSTISDTDGFWVNTDAKGTYEGPVETPPQTGKVYSAAENNEYNPLANAKVYIDGTSVGMTDDQGNFEIPANTPENAVITIQADGYTVGQGTVQNGVVFVQKLDPQKTALGENYDENAGVFEKPTPKVLSSSDGKTVVVVGEDMQLTKDITVQITTYQTPVSAPAYQVLGKNNINATKDLTPSLVVLGGASLEVFDSGGMPTTLSSDEFQATIQASTTQIMGGLGEALNAYTKPMTSEVENITSEAYTKFQQQLNAGKMSLYTMVYDPSSGSWSKAGAAVVKPYTISKKVFDDQGNFVELKEYTKYALTTGEGVSLPTFAPFAFVLQYKSLIGQVSANVVEGGYKMSDGSIVSAPDSQSPDFNWIGAPVNGVMGVFGENQAVSAGLTGPPPTPGPDVYADLSGDGAADVKLSFIAKAIGATVYIEYNNQIKQYSVPSSDTSVDNPYDWAGAAVAGQTGSWTPPAGYSLNPSLDIQPPEQPVKVYGDYAPGSGSITLQYKTPYMSPVIDVIFKKEGYFDTTLQINVLDYYQEGFPTKTVTMYRLPDTASIEGYVREKISQDPIGGALVSLMNPDVLDSIDTAQDDEAGMILSVEKKPNAQYVWEYRKQSDGENATWIKLEPQEANSISSSLIRTTVINNWDQNATANPSGAYDLRVKVTHAYDNDNDGVTDTTYVEEALGHFELLVDQNKLKQLVTGSLSEAVETTNNKYGLYGGSSLGWYELAGTIANEYTLKWTTTIQALASEAMFNDPNTYPNVFQDELVSTVLNPVYVNEIFKSQPYEDAFYPYVYVLGYLSQNFMTLLEDDPNNPGKPFYESGFTVKNTATYLYKDGDGVWTEIQAASYFDLPEDALTEAEQLLLVPELAIVPNTTFAYLRQIYSKEDGFYRFNLVPYEYNAKLEIAGEKQGYAPDYKFVNDLAKGQVSHYDLYLEAFDVPAQAILFTYEEDKQAAEGTWTAANPANAVKWQYLSNPESVIVDSAFVDYADYPDEVTDPNVYTDYQAQLKTDANGTILWTNESENTATLNANSQEYPVYVYLDGEGNVQQIDSVDPNDGDAWIDANGKLMFTVLTGGTPTITLLPAYEGSRNLWFGNTANGVFKEGTGTYGSSHQDSIVSPVLDLSNFSFAALEFKTWFEAESVDIAQNQYDQMLIEATVVNDTGEDVTIKSPSGSYTLTPGQWKQVGTMNPSTEPGWQNQSAVLNYSSGGPDAMPIWINKAINLHPFAGHKIQLRFRFLTQDGLYNYFRGWAVDYLQILNETQIETPPQVGEISETDQSLGRVDL